MSVSGFSSAGLQQYTSPTGIPVGAGNLIWVVLTCPQQSGAIPTDNQGNSYTYSYNLTPNGASGYTYLCSATASQSGTLTITPSTSPFTTYVSVVNVISNASLISNTSGSGSGGTGTFYTTPTTITAANELILIWLENSMALSNIVTNLPLQNGVYVGYNPPIGAEDITFTQPNGSYYASNYVTLTFQITDPLALTLSGSAFGFAPITGTSGVVNSVITPYTIGATTTTIPVTAGDYVVVTEYNSYNTLENPTDTQGNTYTYLSTLTSPPYSQLLYYTVVSQTGNLTITGGTGAWTSTISYVLDITNCGSILQNLSSNTGYVGAGTYYTSAISITQPFESVISLIDGPINNGNLNGFSTLIAGYIFDLYRPPLGSLQQEFSTSNYATNYYQVLALSNNSTQEALSISGSASGEMAPTGTSSDALALSGNASGEMAPTGTSSDALALSGNATGVLTVQGTSHPVANPYPANLQANLKLSRNLRKNIAAYAGTTPEELVAGNLFWPTTYYDSQPTGLLITGLAAGLVNTVICTSSDTLTITGSAAGNFSSSDNATSSGSLALSGQITAAQGETGTSTAALSISGTASGSSVKGTSTDSLSLSGQVTGAQGEQGTSTDLLSLSGVATASHGVAGSASDSLALAGQISGSSVVGSSLDSLSITGSAVGNYTGTGQSSATLSLSGSASASVGESASSSDVLQISGSASGTVKDFIGTASGSLSITGSSAGSITDFIGSAQALLSLTGSASGTVEDFIGTASGSLVLTGFASGAQGEAGTSSDALSLTGSASGSVIDFTGSASALLSLSGSASGQRGAAGTSTGLNIPLTGSATGSQGNQGSSAALLSITGSSVGSVEDFTAYSIEVLSFSGSATANRGVAGAFLTAALLVAGFISGAVGESASSATQMPLMGGSAQAKVITVASSAVPLPLITGSASGLVIFSVHGPSSDQLPLITGSADGQTSNPVNINPAYLINPPARNWVVMNRTRVYLTCPPARDWVQNPAKRNYLVSPPARIWNV